MIYACFAGIGKTYLAKQNFDFVDLESSEYQWLDALEGGSVEGNKSVMTEKNPDFPNNYIQEIAKLAWDGHVLISCQPKVLKLLAEWNLPFVTVYPSLGSKEAFLNRYKDRGNGQEFIELMDNNFENFIHDLATNEDAVARIEITSSETFLTNLFGSYPF